MNTMDLFADAGRGAPLYVATPKKVVASRRWTGALGHKFSLDDPHNFALFLERKEFLLACGHFKSRQWWNWHLGFEGRLTALKEITSNVFWLGFVYSQPRPGLSKMHAEALIKHGLQEISFVSKDLPYALFDTNRTTVAMIITSQYVRGVLLSDLAYRPLNWLDLIDLNYSLEELTWGQNPATIEEFESRYSELRLIDLCGWHLNDFDSSAEIMLPLGRLALIKQRLNAGEVIYLDYTQPRQLISIRL